jgi:hypothetical protein
MNQYPFIFRLLATTGLVFGIFGCQTDPNSPEGILKNMDARQAIAIANEWKWSKKEIRSHVTNREVVFELSEDKVKRIPLPDDEMVVAVAPYVNQTHQ